MPFLSLSAACKSYPNVGQVLGPLDLSAHEGETVAVLGPSGCGKSTCLRLIAGLEAVSGGEVAWSSGAPAPGEIGFVFQDPTLMPWASVLDNILLPLSLKGPVESAGREEALRLITAVGLDGFEAALPKQLSGGMRMRVSLARALVTQPKVLLLDEPFAALDEITRGQLNDALIALKKDRPLTILFVTHSVFESVYLADRIVVMSPRPGRIAAEIKVVPEGPRIPAFRFSQQYAALTKAVSSDLSRAMGETGP